MRELFVTNQFKKDFSKIPVFIRDEANLIVQKLRLNPTDRSFNIRRLTEVKPPVWRARIGSYRLVYAFDRNSIALLRIRHRKDVYRNL